MGESYSPHNGQSKEEKEEEKPRPMNDLLSVLFFHLGYIIQYTNL